MSLRSLTVIGAAVVLSTPAAVALADAPAFVADPTGDRVAGDALRTSPSPVVDHHKPIAARLRSFARDLRAERRQLRERRERRARRAAARAAAAQPTGALAAIAQCESGGNPRAIGGGGTYRGMYQFSYATWAAVGGSGDPAAASVAEQTKRAQILYDTSGPSQWPVCGV
jgi:hypothetical protein